MKICYIYDNNEIYVKNKIILKGIKENKISFINCSSSLKNSFLRNFVKFFKFLTKKKKCDIILVGFVGQPLVKLVSLFTSKPIIFDAYMSVYNTLVDDKKKVRKDSIKAKILHKLDKISCKNSDIILLDTKEHINYFVKEFGIDKKKFRRLFIGAYDEIFFPRKLPPQKKFVVEFHGGFIPLQGIEIIIGAARLLQNEKDILFKIAGQGQTFENMKKRAKGLDNIKFLGHINPKQVPFLINSADVGLGIFGKTDKSQRVIPNKAYEVLACKKPLITEDTKAASELLKHKKNCMLCSVYDAKSLANSIMELKNDKRLREKIANEGYKTFIQYCKPEVLGKELKEIIESI